jgi:hypothetical protein
VSPLLFIVTSYCKKDFSEKQNEEKKKKEGKGGRECGGRGGRSREGEIRHEMTSRKTKADGDSRDKTISSRRKPERQ